MHVIECLEQHCGTISGIGCFAQQFDCVFHEVLVQVLLEPRIVQDVAQRLESRLFFEEFVGVSDADESFEIAERDS